MKEKKKGILELENSDFQWLDKENKLVGGLVLRNQEARPIGSYMEHETNEEVDREEAPVRFSTKNKALTS
ncbi:hypothetical protein ACDX78_04980 [Virgibacillus oceani]